MTDYRLYFHDSGGHFMRRSDLDLTDDKAALAAARRIDHAHCIEIWSGKRKVGLVRPRERSR